MQFLILAQALLLASVAADSVNTYSQQVCRTALRPSQGSGGTTTSSTTLFATKTVTQTITPVSTVIPSSTTITKSTTTIVWSTQTLPQTTNTFSATLSFTTTNSAYTTLISTITSSVIQTTTSAFTTTTVQPSAGFIPLASALAAEGHVAARRVRRNEEVAVRRAVPAAIEERATQQQIICGTDGKITFNPPQYQGSVTCYKRVQVVTTKTITTTAQTTKTIQAPRGTVTQTSTSTQTKTTTTSLPVASTTVTVSVTSTLSTTITASSTLTTSLTSISTIYAPQPTYYAACAPNNIVSYVDNTRISNIAAINQTNGFSFGSGAASPYDCCVQCLMTNTCAASTYHPASSNCYFFAFGASNTCSATQQVGTFSKGTGNSPVGFVVSNGNCGEIEYV